MTPAETSFIPPLNTRPTASLPEETEYQQLDQNPFSPAFCPGATPPPAGQLLQNAQDTDWDEDECSGGCGLGDDTPGVFDWTKEFDD
jgi:hypothetical protein